MIVLYYRHFYMGQMRESWSDAHRTGADRWLDRQMLALQDFAVTITFCFTPDDQGISPHYKSPPKDTSRFADFCARMVRRYETESKVSTA